MAYIGAQPRLGNFQACDAISTSATDTFNLLVGGTAIFPQSAQHCLVSLNGVLQAPISSYTISGSTIVFASALTSSDSIDFITILGDTLDLGVPSDDTVGAAQIKADLISGTTALTATPATTDELLISDAGVLKRIDAQFFQNTPAFEAILSSSASINHDTATKVQCNTEVFDTASAYDNSTNYRFTPQTAGKYLVYSKVRIDTTAANCEVVVSYIYKNGSSYTYSVIDFDSNDGEGATTINSSIIDMNGSSDYVELYAYGKSASGSGTLGVEGASSNYPTLFGAYKLIGV